MRGILRACDSAAQVNNPLFITNIIGAASRGNSGGSVVALARVGTGANEKVVLGAGDYDSGVHLDSASTASGSKAANSEVFSPTEEWVRHCHDLGSVNPLTGNNCAIRAFQALTKDTGDPVGNSDVWGVANYGVPPAVGSGALPQSDGFLRLVHMRNVDQAGSNPGPIVEIYPEIFDWRKLANGDGPLPTEPTTADLKYLVYYPNGLRIGENAGLVRSHGNASLATGKGNNGKSLLFASLPGAGVAAIDVAAVHAAEGVTGDSTALLVGQWKVTIPFQSCKENDSNCTANSVLYGACVTSVEFIDGYLYATVGRSMPGPPIADQSIEKTSVTHCNIAINPGLYRAPFDTFPSSGPVPVLKRVKDFDDPRALAVTTDISGNPLVIVADWLSTAPEATNSCSAGLWRWRPKATSPSWDYIARQEGITAMTFESTDLASPASHKLWFTVANLRRWDWGGMGVWPDASATALGGWAAKALHVTPSHPGVFRIDAGSVTGLAVPQTPTTDSAWKSSPAIACTDTDPQWSTNLASVGDCAVSSATCTAVTASASGVASSGLASAGSWLAAISVNHESAWTDLAVGTVYGQGAWQLPAPEFPITINVKPPGWQATWCPRCPDPGNLPERPDIGWRWKFGDGKWMQQPAFGSPSTWIGSQLGPLLDEQKWYSINITRAQADEVAADLANAPQNLAFSAMTDGVGPSVDLGGAVGAASFPIQDGSFGLRGVAQLARIRVTFEQPLPAGSALWLNGTNLIAVSDGTEATRRVAMTGSLMAGINDLSARRSDGTVDTNVHFVRVDTALGTPLLSSRRSDAGATATTVRFFNDGPAARPHGLWLVARLSDGSRPTTIQFEGGATVAIQSGTRASANTWRVPVDATRLRHGDMTAEVRAGVCSGGACSGSANLVDAFLLVEFNDERSYCLPTAETCNSHDDDCDGLTDESSGALCDGPDPDGCSLGVSACAPATTCGETVSAQGLSPAPASLIVALSGVDAIFDDGRLAQVPQFPAQLDIVSALTNGADISNLDGIVLPTGSNRLLRFVLHLSASPSISWNNVQSTVAVRSLPADDGMTLTLDVPGGTDLTAGQHLILVADNAPDALAVNTFFGCPGGEITFPSHLRVRNGCDFLGVNCTAATGLGSACDSSPASVLCPGCTGDYDGCKFGNLLPIGAQGAWVCSADDPVTAASPAPSSLWIGLATATFYFDRGGPVTVTADPTPFDLFGVLAAGASRIPAFFTPPPTAGNDGAKVVAIRMTLASATSAQMPNGQGGALTVVPRSGAEDSGLDIDLQFPAGGTYLPPGAPVMAIAQASSSPSGWQAVFQCGPTDWTMLRRIKVVNLCDTPGACGQ